MKRAVKEHPMVMSEYYEAKNYLKKVPEGLVYAVTKEIFKEGKILFTIVQKVNLKML